MRRMLLAVACVLAVAGCGYIVTPEDDASPTPKTSGQGWTAVTTKVEAAGSGLHADITLRNDTGDWSSMAAAPSGSVTLAGSDGKSVACSNIVIGSGGNNIAPGLQLRGYTGGTVAAPKVVLVGVDCAAAPAAGQVLTVSYTYTTGPFNYYSPTPPAAGKLTVDLDKVASGLTYPVGSKVDGLVELSTTSINAINKCVLTLTKVARDDTGFTFSWHVQNPTDYPVYVHIGTPPVIGSDGVVYGFYTSPHLAITPIAPAKATAEWTTTVTVPKDVTGPLILLSVESQSQKFFVSHLVDVSSK
jgi:hypothetical protein